MVRRKRIGLIFTVDPNWMGGTYYILNLINALNTLPDSQKPELILLCSSEDDYRYAKDYTKYPFLSYRLTFKPKKIDIPKLINKVSRRLIGKSIIPASSFSEKVDAVYPVIDSMQINTPTAKIYWIPDFQEIHYPDFFTKSELNRRRQKNMRIAQQGQNIIFSSNDALKDFQQNYDCKRNINTAVVHFASSIPSYHHSSTKAILQKFNIDRPFFFCANQIWQHKNHLTLFKAVNELKKQGLNPLLVCSGGTIDYRNKEYSDFLQRYISENNLKKNIILPGFISREELVCLMSECIAIVQPSLFEGWNTGVEEAKALNKFMIVSDIPLHREQIKNNVKFFSPLNYRQLSEVMRTIMEKAPEIEPYNYENSIRNYGCDFMNYINNIANNH